MEVEILNTAEVSPATNEQMLAFDQFTKEQSGVYGILCPRKHRYTAEQIWEMKDVPERVRQLVEMTKDRFYKYEVWSSELYEVKDPIILGREADPKQPTYDWYDKIFLLARWGAELDSFTNLKKKAAEILEEKIVVDFMKIKSKVDMFLSNPKVFVKRAIDSGETTEPSFDFPILR